MRHKRILALMLAVFVFAVMGWAQSVRTIQSATGALTAAATTSAVSTLGRYAIITLDVTTITTADADDEIDFYIQTTYDNTNWVDCENIHFDNSDNGSTAKRVIVIDGALDGPGSIKSIAGTDPAAGGEVSETVPANAVWRLKSLYASLVTDANVANREVSLSIDDGTNTYSRAFSGQAHPASTTGLYSVSPVGTRYNRFLLEGTAIPIPSQLSSAGHRFVSITGNLQAGDNYGAPQLLVEEWHDPLVLTDGTIRDNVRSYNRPLGSQIRIKMTMTGASAPTVAYSATVLFQ